LFVLEAVLVVILEPTVELAQFQFLYVEPMASGKLQFRLHNSKYFVRAFNEKPQKFLESLKHNIIK
jgi:hypothetical protein